MSIEEIKVIIGIIGGTLGILGCLITWTINLIKSIKAKDWSKIKATMTSVIIPLMEQAERNGGEGQDKETWVIEKLSKRLHIDFFKYQKYLDLAKNIIADICKTTKIEVNKDIILEEQWQQEEDTNDGIL